MTAKMKPMTASPAGNIAYPVYGSPKIDGIRAIVKDGQLLSRTLKPIPNHFTQHRFNIPKLNGLDGELVVGSPTHPNCMQNTTSGVMSHDKTPDVHFYLFDVWNALNEYEKRKRHVEYLVSVMTIHAPDSAPYIHFVPQVLLNNEQELQKFEESMLALGYEGIMLRSPNGKYKFGRSTAKEGYLLKVKRFSDSEANIISAHELMHNENEAKKDELGRTKRSTHKENLVPSGMLGSLICVDCHTRQNVDIGSGFTKKQREELWKLHLAGKLTGQIVKYKHFEIGVVTAPRHPIFLGFRDPIDIEINDE